MNKPTKGIRLKLAIKILIVLSIFCSTLVAQGGGRQTLEGVWKVTEIVFTGAGAYVTSAPQPGVFIFTKSYYSWTWLPGTQPRALFKAEAPTTEEKLAAFDSLPASSGTYELNGSMVTFRPIVAKGPNIVSIDEHFQIEGDTLTLTWASSDSRTRIGGEIVRSTAPPSQGRMKLIRVE
jgi:hypothetical protein